MKYEFVKPTIDDAVYVATHLKHDNYVELFAIEGDNAVRDVVIAMARSRETGCLKIDGVPTAVYGVIPDSVFGGTGCVWLLLTAETKRHKVFIGKHTKKGIERILRDYDKVYNYCNAGNKSILKWLDWMGAKIYPAEPFGIWNIPHHYFEFTKEGE